MLLRGSGWCPWAWPGACMMDSKGGTQGASGWVEDTLSPPATGRCRPGSVNKGLAPQLSAASLGSEGCQEATGTL